MSHWVADYIGLPWRAYATGPDAYDCHGLVWHCLSRHYGVDMSRYREVITNDYRAISQVVKSEQQTGCWQQLDQPQDGAIVLIGTLRTWHHIGLWVEVNGGRCLHSHQGLGVGLDRLGQLTQTTARTEYWIHRSLLP